MDKKSEELNMKKIISARISDLLSQNNMKQNELSEILGVDNSTVGKWIAMKTIPRMGVIQKMADYFGVGKSYFFEDVPSSARLKARREELGLDLKEVSDYVGVSEITLLKWETGDIGKMPSDKVVKLAKILKCSPLYVADMIDRLDLIMTNVQAARVNVYGSIPAGVPLEAIEDIQDWEEIPQEWTKGGKEYIALKVKGDSMYPKYLDGDTVIILLQQDCESGQDCACYVNGYDATLKTVIKGDNKITLNPINPNYAPQTYKHPGEVKILGIVKELRRKV